MNRDERSSGSQPGVVGAAADPMIGQVLDGRYRLTERLGEGGMGEVYAAEHIHIEKRVAIKLLRSEILANQEAVTRFRQEARSASSIGHRNIITIEDFGQLPDGRIFLAMELLHGAPLSDLIKQPQSPDRLINVLIQTGHGLSAAHRKGIVHRDMKPENVFVTFTPDGEDVPKLLDFGIAKMSAGDGNNHLTKTGTIFGTPFYMAPEQALGQNVDHRADVYAMGVIMYEAFGGSVPFQGDSFMAILTQHITSEPKPLAHVAAQHGKSLPMGMEEIIARCMRKEPEQRFQSMDELVAALVAVYRGVAGAGMSGYMAAHRSGGQPGMSGPFQGPTGTIAASGGARPMGHTPMPYSGGHGAQFRREGSVRYPVPQPDPQFTSSMPAATDSGAFPQRPKNRIGLFLVLLVVMAAVGSGIALLVLSQTQGSKKATAGTSKPRPPEEPVVVPPTDLPLAKKAPPVGSNDPGKTEPTNTDPSGTEPGKTDPTKTDPSGTAPVADAGAGEPGKTDPTGTEPGKTEPGKTEPGKTGPGKTEPGKRRPKPTLTQVLVNSRPQGAVVHGPDGKRLGKTPVNVWVEPGKTLEVTLKRRGHRELRASIDDGKKKVTLKMERVMRPPVEPPDPFDPGEDVEPEEPRELGPCEEDPSSIDCRCERSPDLPECGLE
jgi:eukaryotic-like serine/threonine-protein kinase